MLADKWIGHEPSNPLNFSSAKILCNTVLSNSCLGISYVHEVQKEELHEMKHSMIIYKTCSGIFSYSS